MFKYAYLTDSLLTLIHGLDSVSVLTYMEIVTCLLQKITSLIVK